MERVQALIQSVKIKIQKKIQIERVNESASIRWGNGYCGFSLLNNSSLLFRLNRMDGSQNVKDKDSPWGSNWANGEEREEGETWAIRPVDLFERARPHHLHERSVHSQDSGRVSYLVWKSVHTANGDFGKVNQGKDPCDKDEGWCGIHGSINQFFLK